MRRVVLRGFSMLALAAVSGCGGGGIFKVPRPLVPDPAPVATSPAKALKALYLDLLRP